MTAAPRPPARLGRGGRALWRAVVEDFDLNQNERMLLDQACRTADLIDKLQAQLEADGLMRKTSQGERVHPAAVELRQQRITLARLFVALELPRGMEGDEPIGRPQRRGTRGFYSVAGGRP